jgi:hypothetical protein
MIIQKNGNSMLAAPISKNRWMLSRAKIPVCFSPIGSSSSFRPAIAYS